MYFNFVFYTGTELYDSKKGSFVDLSMLDVLQIFGRAGRPQYDKSGEAFIITTHDKVALYLSLLTRQSPIESQFILSLADNLNPISFKKETVDIDNSKIFFILITL